MEELRCAHGKTMEEECPECEQVLVASGLSDLMDALIDEEIELPEE